MKTNQLYLSLRTRRKPVYRKAGAVSIFKRKESRYWQAYFTVAGRRHRISTGTTIAAAALEYALLAYRHAKSISY